MHIEKIEYGLEKTGLWSQVAFALIILLTLAAVAITGNIFWMILSSDASAASTRSFIEEVGKLLAYLLFDLGAIIYLYVKGLLQDEYVTTLE
jgi:flagellar basal body-associated protein FliL